MVINPASNGSQYCPALLPKQREQGPAEESLSGAGNL
jgi:hypothetical protein